MTVASPIYEFVAGWQQAAAGLRVADVTVDNEDRIYLLARDGSGVLQFGQDGDLLSSWTHPLIGTGAHGITVDEQLNVFVVDWLQHFVAKFTRRGELLFLIGTPGHAADNGIEPWPPKELPYPVERLSRLHPTGPFNGCTKLAVGSNGDLYVSDGYGNCRIHHFDANGRLLASYGTPGLGPGEFHNPHSVFIASDGLLYVSDRENDRVQILTPDLEFVREIPVQRPAAAAVDGNGRVAVASLRYAAGEPTFKHGRPDQVIPDRLTVFESNCEVVFESDGAIVVPNGLAVDSSGNVYVAQVGSYHAVNEDARAAHPVQHAMSAVPSLAKFRRLR